MGLLKRKRCLFKLGGSFLSNGTIRSLVKRFCLAHCKKHIGLSYFILTNIMVLLLINLSEHSPLVHINLIQQTSSSDTSFLCDFPFYYSPPLCSYIYLSSVSFLCFFCPCAGCSGLKSLIDTQSLSSLSMFPLQKVRRPPVGHINYPSSHYTLKQRYQHVTQCFQKFPVPSSLPLSLTGLCVLR